MCTSVLFACHSFSLSFLWCFHSWIKTKATFSSSLCYSLFATSNEPTFFRKRRVHLSSSGLQPESNDYTKPKGGNEGESHDAGLGVRERERRHLPSFLLLDCTCISVHAVLCNFLLITFMSIDWRVRVSPAKSSPDFPFSQVFPPPVLASWHDAAFPFTRHLVSLITETRGDEEFESRFYRQNMSFCTGLLIFEFDRHTLPKKWAARSVRREETLKSMFSCKTLCCSSQNC